jgi:hypothetical protein
MAIFKLVEGLTYAAVAAEDLSASLNRFVKLDGNGEVVLCGADEKAIGTLFEAAALGAAASIQMGGICKVVAGTSITAGARVACGANGKAKSGTTNPVGIALDDAAGDGSVISVAMVG